MDEDLGHSFQHLPAAFPQAFYIWNETGTPGGLGYFGTYPVVGEAGTFIVYYYRGKRHHGGGGQHRACST